MVLDDVADPVCANIGRTYTQEGRGNFRLTNVVLAEVAAPITHGGHPGSNAPGRHAEDDVNLVACFDESQMTHPENRATCGPETAHVASTAKPPTVVFSLRGREEGNVPAYGISRDAVDRSGEASTGTATDRSGLGVTRELSATIKARGPNAVAAGAAVRRLTPIECERLFGLPDNWTAIPYRGKPAKNTPRYAALGNSIPVTVLRWLGRRIQEVS